MRTHAIRRVMLMTVGMTLLVGVTPEIAIATSARASVAICSRDRPVLVSSKLSNMTLVSKSAEHDSDASLERGTWRSAAAGASLEGLMLLRRG